MKQSGTRRKKTVSLQTHPYISTGLHENKFGIEVDSAERLFVEFRNDPVVSLTGIDCHIGSQITEILPFRDAFKIILDIVERLKDQGQNYFKNTS